jgi:hypothetical protein
MWCESSLSYLIRRWRCLHGWDWDCDAFDFFWFSDFGNCFGCETRRSCEYSLCLLLLAAPGRVLTCTLLFLLPRRARYVSACIHSSLYSPWQVAMGWNVCMKILPLTLWIPWVSLVSPYRDVYTIPISHLATSIPTLTTTTVSHSPRYLFRLRQYTTLVQLAHILFPPFQVQIPVDLLSLTFHST